MRAVNTWKAGAVAIAVAVLLWPGAALAQEETGNLHGTVVDQGGGVLPGATVQLSGIGATRTQVTNESGAFRFINLSPGTYQLTASMDNFSTAEYTNVTVALGRSTTLTIELSAAVGETITVTSESPLLDERKVSKGTTVSYAELEKIPTARDPWAILSQAPGVLTDRVNVGGDQSGQQSVFTGAGVSDDENNFAVDGVVITDMAAIGASPTYYDFDQFQEMQITTGGSDIEQITAGVSMNLVTKRGTNQPRGSARFLLTDADGRLGGLDQGTHDFSDQVENGDGNGGLNSQSAIQTTGNQVNEIEDVGFEVGGPIVRDRLWLWGSWGQNDIKQINSAGNADDTILENQALKVNAQVATPNSFVASYNKGDKLKFGRLGRPPAERSLASSWDQDGPTEVWKAEDSHVFNPNFFANGQFSFIDGGFQLQTKGGGFPSAVVTTDAEVAKSQGESLFDPSGVWQNGWYSGATDRDTTGYRVDGNYFFDTGNTSHELKFGAGYREFEVESPFGWPGGRDNYQLACEGIGACGFFTGVYGLVGDDVGVAARLGKVPGTQEYTEFFAQDTITLNRLTLNAGFRYDIGEGVNEPDVVPAHPLFPAELPALDFQGNDGGFDDWSTAVPRIGATYALGEQRDTLLRASYSRYAEQLSATDLDNVNPVGYSAFSYVFDDVDGDDYYDVGEPFDIISPLPSTSLVTINEVDPGFGPEITDELLFGVEHSLLPEFVVGLDFTWRETSDIQEHRSFIFDETGAKRVVTADDFELTPPVCSDGITVPHLPDGQSWCADYYSLRDGLEFAGGTLLTNGERVVEYQGVSLTFTKRLSNRWMARGFFQFTDQEWQDTADFRAHSDPTNSAVFELPADSTLPSVGGDNDGELYVIASAASGPFSNVFIQSSWSANINGMYQVAPDQPWGFNVAGNLFTREGFVLPYRYDPPGAAREEALVAPEVDSFRADDPMIVDLRLEKEMAFSSGLSGVVSLDAFNVFNEDAVTQREVDLDTATANFLTGTISPRVYRLGFRLNWR